MSHQFKEFMSFIIFMLFFGGLFSFAGVSMYFVDEHFMSLKKAIACAVIGVFCLIIDTVICYWVWG